MADEGDTTIWDSLQAEYGDKFKDPDIKPEETRKVLSINGLGSAISERLAETIRISASIKDMTSISSEYTPVSFSTYKIYKELGLSTPFGTMTSKGGLYEGGISPDNKSSGLMLGEALVMNPSFQFNANDDVRSNGYFPKIGRIYNKTILDNLPVVVFEVGRIKYNKNTISQFLNPKADPETDNIKKMIRGDTSILDNGVAAMGTVIKSAMGVATAVPNLIAGLRKFAVFENDMPNFAKYVDEMLAQLSVYFGLATPFDEGAVKDVDLSEINITDSETSDTLTKKVSGAWASDKPTKTTPFGSDDAWKSDKLLSNYAGGVKFPQLFYIIPGANNHQELYTRQYIPYQIHKDVTVSERISNSTEANPVASQLNEVALDAQTQDQTEGTASGDNNAIEDLKTYVSKQAKTMVDSIAKGDAAYIVSGDGRVSMPDVWSNSSFERSFSLKFKFTSPYGDDLSVFENTIIPFAILFAMSAPRQIGKRTYTSPFVIRAFSKGWFSCPMGMVESLSISRGESKNNWTVSGRPRTIEVDMNIKDLSPVMMMSLNAGNFGNLHMSNEGMASYLTTLGSLSIAEQKNIFKRFDNWVVGIKSNVLAFLAVPAGGVGNVVTHAVWNNSGLSNVYSTIKRTFMSDNDDLGRNRA